MTRTEFDDAMHQMAETIIFECQGLERRSAWKDAIQRQVESWMFCEEKEKPQPAGASKARDIVNHVMTADEERRVFAYMSTQAQLRYFDLRSMNDVSLWVAMAWVSHRVLTEISAMQTARICP